MPFRFLVILTILTFSCAPKMDPPPADLKAAIVGDWETSSFKVKVRTANNRDSSYTVNVSSKDWRKKMKLKPIRITFTEDHKYKSDYKNNRDSILERHRGMWNIFGDTLVMIEPNATYHYEVSWRRGQAYFNGRIDWDNDGREDDEYTGIYTRVE